MMARLDQIAALLARMDATLAKSLAASTKPEGTLDQVRKGMDELSQAVKSVPALPSGGVGDRRGPCPLIRKTQAATPNDWTVRIDGLDALGATVQGADKTVGHAADAVKQQSDGYSAALTPYPNFPDRFKPGRVIKYRNGASSKAACKTPPMSSTWGKGSLGGWAGLPEMPQLTRLAWALKKFPRNLRTCWQKERRRWRPGRPE